MPQVPVVEAPTVGIEITPRPALRQAVGGVQAYRTGQAIGKLSDSIGQIALSIQNRDNVDAVLQAETALKDRYLEWSNKAQQRKGFDAKGLAQEAEDWWEAQGKDALASLTNQPQRDALVQRLNPMRQAAVGQWSRYELTNRDQATATAADASIRSAAKVAIDAKGDSEVVAASREQIVRAADTAAALQGWDAGTRDEYLNSHLSAMHTGVIASMADDNPAGARAYYEQHKGEIHGAEREQAEKLVRSAGLRFESQQWTDKILAMGLGENAALAYIREHLGKDADTAELRDAVETRVSQDYARRRSMIELAQRNASDEGWRIYNDTGDVNAIPVAVQNSMDPIALRNLRDYAKRDAMGLNVVTDFAAYNDLADMARSDPTRFAQVDLNQYRTMIASPELTQLKKWQGNPPNDIGATGMLNWAFGQLDLGTENKADKEARGKIRREFDRRVAETTERLKRPPSDQELRAIMGNVIAEGVDTNWWDNDARAYESGGAGWKPNDPKTYTSNELIARGYRIPPADLDQILIALRRGGKPVTIDNIIAVYDAANGTR